MERKYQVVEYKIYGGPVVGGILKNIVPPPQRHKLRVSDVVSMGDDKTYHDFLTAYKVFQQRQELLRRWGKNKGRDMVVEIRKLNDYLPDVWEVI